MNPQVSHIHHGGKKDHRKMLSNQRRQELEKELFTQKKEKSKPKKFQAVVMKLRSLLSTINDNDHSLFIN